MMNSDTYTIYIGGAKVVIATSAPAIEGVTLMAEDKMSVSRAKLLKKVETDKYVTIITSNPRHTFARLAKEFVVVEAAGGVVVREDGAMLMIRLRDRWDLPKGHVEEGECGSMAALREVEEETGIVAELCDTEPMAVTWHAYDTYGRWELKRTRWWRMRYKGGEPKAQAEEGITAVSWQTTAEDAAWRNETYETIKTVVAALDGKTNRL